MNLHFVFTRSGDTDIVVTMNYRNPWSAKKFFRNFTVPFPDEHIRNCVFVQWNTDLRETIQDIRKQAYEKGWKDKGSHKKLKQTWFNGCAGRTDCQ